MTQRKNVNKHRKKKCTLPELLGVKFQHQLILSAYTIHTSDNEILGR